MAYKIAVASSSGVKVDETFGSAKQFFIFSVTKDGFLPPEERVCPLDNAKDTDVGIDTDSFACPSSTGCEDRSGCGTGGGCSSFADNAAKVCLIEDCRCVVCRKIGFQIQKQLERKAISAFDVGCSIDEALQKITAYYSRIDQHQSLRK